jgi:hypothetical protein
MNRTEQLDQETYDSDAPVDLDPSELACVSGGMTGNLTARKCALDDAFTRRL